VSRVYITGVADDALM